MWPKWSNGVKNGKKKKAQISYYPKANPLAASHLLWSMHVGWVSFTDLHMVGRLYLVKDKNLLVSFLFLWQDSFLDLLPEVWGDHMIAWHCTVICFCLCELKKNYIRTIWWLHQHHCGKHLQNRTEHVLSHKAFKEMKTKSQCDFLLS